MRDVVAEDEGPETQFAWVGEDRIAYQVFGEGDIDLLFAASTGDAIDLRWTWPPYADFLRRLGTHARVIMFDRRGFGSSDNASGEPLPSWERWADDARAVLDAAESERAVLLGVADGGPVTILFAASHPRRTRGLILTNTAAVFTTRDEAALQERISEAWGTPAVVEFAFPDAARDPAFVRWAGRSIRLSCTPRDATEGLPLETQMDVREALASVRVPTLVLHREDCQVAALDDSRYLAEQVAGAQLACFREVTSLCTANRPRRACGSSRNSCGGYTAPPNPIGRWPRSCSPTWWDPPSSSPR